MQKEIFECNQKFNFFIFTSIFMEVQQRLLAILLHSLGSQNIIERIRKRSETKLRQFGYRLYYQNVSINHILNSTGCPFVITIFMKSSLPVITRLNVECGNNNIQVIHDHHDISERLFHISKINGN
jgi:hypothetical protein